MTTFLLVLIIIGLLDISSELGQIKDRLDPPPEPPPEPVEAWPPSPFD